MFARRLSGVLFSRSLPGKDDQSRLRKNSSWIQNRLQSPLAKPDMAMLEHCMHVGESMMFEVQGIDYVALPVRDIERSTSWYLDVLGLERIHGDYWKGVPTVVGIGETAIAHFAVRGEDPARPPGKNMIAMRHVAFRVDRPNFEAAQSELQARSIEIEFQDHEISHSICFHDPGGHELKITTYDVQVG